MSAAKFNAAGARPTLENPSAAELHPIPFSVVIVAFRMGMKTEKNVRESGNLGSYQFFSLQHQLQITEEHSEQVLQQRRLLPQLHIFF